MENHFEDYILSLQPSVLESLSDDTLKHLHRLISREVCKRQQQHPYTLLLEWRIKDPRRRCFTYYTKTHFGWIVSLDVTDENNLRYFSSRHCYYSDIDTPSPPKKEALRLASSDMIQQLELGKKL